MSRSDLEMPGVIRMDRSPFQRRYQRQDETGPVSVCVCVCVCVCLSISLSYFVCLNSLSPCLFLSVLCLSSLSVILSHVMTLQLSLSLSPSLSLCLYNSLSLEAHTEPVPFTF